MHDHLDDLSLRLVRRDRGSARLVVRGLTTDDRLDDIGRLAGLPPGVTWRIDGRDVPGTTPVLGAGLRQGASVAPASPPDPPAALRLLVIAGYDAGREILLPPGRYVLGSSPHARCRVADPGLAAHHATLEVDARGRVRATDLGVGRPLIGGGRWLVTGERLVIGDVRLELCPPEAYPAHAGATAIVGWQVPLVRKAIVRPPVPPVIRRPPDDPRQGAGPSAIGLVTTATTLLAGIVAALVFRQPAMLLLTGVVAAGALVTSGFQFGRDARRRRHARRSLARANAAFDAAVAGALAAEEHRRQPLLPWSGCTEEVTLRGVWQRRDPVAQPVEVLLGRGDLDVVIPAEPDPVDAVVHDVGVPFPLTGGSVLAINGPAPCRLAVARSIIAQLVISTGPADLRVLIATGATPGGQWASWAWLPHAVSGDGAVMIADPSTIEPLVRRLLDDPDRRPLLVVVDGGDQLAVRTGPVRRLVDHPDLHTITLVLGDASAPVHARCQAVLRLGPNGGAELHRFAPVPGEPPGAPVVQRLTPFGAAADVAEAIAARLAGWRDPEHAGSSGQLPAAVGLGELLGARTATPAAIRTRWASSGDDARPVAVLGSAADGIIELDLERDGPHALIAGTTGAGKSELLRTLVVSLAATAGPQAVSFLLLDYKGGSAFDALRTLPHVTGIITDLDERLAGRVLASLDAELRRREARLRDASASDLTAYRRACADEPLPRLVVVVDEFAALAAELPEFLHSLVAVAQRGRSLGVHLVLATQRPSGVISDEIRANTNLRIALRVQDPADSLDVIGERDAAFLPRHRPGRAIARLGPGELIELQTAWCTGDSPAEPSGLRVVVNAPIEETAGDGAPREHPADAASTTAGERSPVHGEARIELVERIVEAAAGLPARPVRRLWTEPLPAVLHPSAAGDIGLIDDVAGQRRRPLRWANGDGHLAIAGGLGTGTTSTLARLALAAAAEASPQRLHLWVLDAAGTGELDALSALPHCVAVVDGRRSEHLARLLDRLTTEIAAAPAGDGIGRLLLVDGTATLRSTLRSVDAAELAERFERLVTEGGRAGLRIAFAADSAAALPLGWLSRCSQRWVGRLADPLDGVALGLPPGAAWTDAPPGRFIVRADGGRPLEAQIAFAEAPLAEQVAGLAERWAATPGPPRLASVPRVLGAHQLPAAAPGEPLHMPIGLGVTDARPVELRLAAGDHALVAGGRATGKTSLLALLAEQWAHARPEGWVGVLDARRDRRGGPLLLGELASLDPELPALLLVDEADRWDDPGGVIARLLGEDRSGLHVVAAGRPEALRAAGYGHWTATIRRSRIGLLLGAMEDVDADVLGVHVPRRALTRAPAHPGRALLVDNGDVRPVQLAVPRVLGAA